MNTSNTEKKDKEQKLFDYFIARITSRTDLTIHKEVAAWTYAALYLTFIFILYNVFSDTQNKAFIEFACSHFWIIVSFVILSLWLVALLIHTQYGRHYSDRAMNAIHVYYSFKIMSGELPTDKLDWTVDNNEILPNFIKNEIKGRTKMIHRFWNIFPGISLLWSIYKFFYFIYFIFFICSIRLIGHLYSKIFKKSKNDEKIKEWKYSPWKFFVEDKINLIESTLYTLLIVYSFFFIIWLCNQINSLKIQ